MFTTIPTVDSYSKQVGTTNIGQVERNNIDNNANASPRDLLNTNDLPRDPLIINALPPGDLLTIEKMLAVNAINCTSILKVRAYAFKHIEAWIMAMINDAKLVPNDDNYIATCNKNNILNANEYVALVAIWIGTYYSKEGEPMFTDKNNSVFVARFNSIIDDENLTLKSISDDINLSKTTDIHIQNISEQSANRKEEEIVNENDNVSKPQVVIKMKELLKVDENNLNVHSITFNVHSILFFVGVLLIASILNCLRKHILSALMPVFMHCFVGPIGALLSMFLFNDDGLYVTY